MPEGSLDVAELGIAVITCVLVIVCHRYVVDSRHGNEAAGDGNEVVDVAGFHSGNIEQEEGCGGRFDATLERHKSLHQEIDIFCRQNIAVHHQPIQFESEFCLERTTPSSGSRSCDGAV